METGVVVAVTTVDSERVANQMARILVEKEMAACVQVAGPVQSHYRWEGKACQDQEWQVWMKCVQSKVDQIGRWLDSNHPYDAPQFVVLPVINGSRSYLNWVLAASGGSSDV